SRSRPSARNIIASRWTSSGNAFMRHSATVWTEGNNWRPVLAAALLLVCSAVRAQEQTQTQPLPPPPPPSQSLPAPQPVTPSPQPAQPAQPVPGGTRPPGQ